MNDAEFQLRAVGDPRLAVHATSALPAWLWSTDGTRVLWANAVGARLFGADNSAALASRSFGPADAHRRQVAQLARRLPSTGTIRLERLRGFGAPLGMLTTCGCARLEFPDGSQGILVAPADTIGRSMPLVDRLQRLVDGIDTPIAAFAPDGTLVAASDAARPLLGFRNLAEAGLEDARNDALKSGRSEAPIDTGQMMLQRVGSGADISLVALIAPPASQAAHVGQIPTSPPAASSASTSQPVAPAAERPIPDYEQPANSGEAPAEFALIDEFVESPSAQTAEAAVAEPAQQPFAPPAEQPIPDYEQPANSGEAPAEFALIDEFVESPPARTAEAAVAEPGQQPFAPAAEQPIPDYEQAANSGEAPAEFALIDELVESAPAEARVEPVVSEEPPDPDLQSVLQIAVPQVAASQAEASPATIPDIEVHLDESSSCVEAVADGAAPPPFAKSPAAIDSAPPSSAPQTENTPPWLDQPLPTTRRHPLRFMWRMDAEGRFSIGSDEFTHLIGARTAAGFGRPWSEVAEAFALDPDGRVAKAVATRNTWSGITLNWPIDGGGRLPVELSGLPIYDRTRNFAGYRGFGVCRDLDGLARLAALRRYEIFSDPPTPQTLSADVVPAEAAKEAPGAEPPAADLPAEPSVASTSPSELSASSAAETSQQTGLETPVETPKNVLPFRPPGETKSPALTPVENSAFNELARQLSARLEKENGAAAATPADTPEAVIEQPAAPKTLEPASATPEWLAAPEPPARGETRRDKALLDLLPVGVLIYRLDRLLYANSAFLARMGYPSLHALEEAGGLDALYVEPGVSSASSTSGTGRPVTISTSQASPEDAPPPGIAAHLFTISWDDDSALALIFSGTGTEGTDVGAAIAEPAAASGPSAVGHANAEELGAILDTAAEGIVMFEAEGNISSCNRSAEALFGYDGHELVQRNLAELFAPESQPPVRD
jgi:PAS domain-containing protein